MSDWDLELLCSFIKRPGMYIGDLELKKVDLFLMAYEIGTQNKCNFRSKLIEHIFDKYQSNKNISELKDNQSIGTLAKQITVLSNQIDLNWKDVFQNEGFEILVQESDQNGRNRYARILRRNLKKVLESIVNNNEMQWAIGYYQINKQVKEWRGKNLTSIEVQFVDKIQKEIDSMFKNSKNGKYEFSKTGDKYIIELLSEIDLNLKTTDNNRSGGQ